MNPNNVLANLSRGVVVTQSTCPVPVVVAANQNTVETQVCTPPQVSTIDISCLNSTSSNEVEFTFTNNTGANQVVWFSSLFGGQGQAADFGKSAGAVDFPAFIGTGPGPGPQANGGQDLARFNLTLIGAGPVIVSKIEILVSTSGAQRNQRLFMDNNDITRDECTPSKLAGICDACPNNDNTDQFTVRFNGPFGLGGNQSLGYTVLDGEEVTMRFTIIGQTIYSFAPVGNGTASC